MNQHFCKCLHVAVMRQDVTPWHQKNGMGGSKTQWRIYIKELGIT